MSTDPWISELITHFGTSQVGARTLETLWKLSRPGLPGHAADEHYERLRGVYDLNFTMSPAGSSRADGFCRVWKHSQGAFWIHLRLSSDASATRHLDIRGRVVTPAVTNEERYSFETMERLRFASQGRDLVPDVLAHKQIPFYEDTTGGTLLNATFYGASHGPYRTLRQSEVRECIPQIRELYAKLRTRFPGLRHNNLMSLDSYLVLDGPGSTKHLRLIGWRSSPDYIYPRNEEDAVERFIETGGAGMF